MQLERAEGCAEIVGAGLNGRHITEVASARGSGAKAAAAVS